MTIELKRPLRAGLEALIAQVGEETGVRLSLIDDVPTWEPAPGPGHQVLSHEITVRIEVENQGNTTGCGCWFYADTQIKYPDGSYGRPDISIFCEEPAEVFESINRVPDAVVEIVSQGYEKKDIEVLKPFYLRIGVKDVVLVNPMTFEVTHSRSDGDCPLHAPVTIHLLSGCRLTIPLIDWSSRPRRVLLPN